MDERIARSINVLGHIIAVLDGSAQDDKTLPPGVSALMGEALSVVKCDLTDAQVRIAELEREADFLDGQFRAADAALRAEQRHTRELAAKLHNEREVSNRWFTRWQEATKK
jgi:predicted phage gp36 major capsid-like protein